MLSSSSCLAYAPDRRLSACRAVHSRPLPSAPRLQPAAPRLSGKTLGDADDRKQPRTACSALFSGWREPSKQDDEASQQLTDSSGEEEEAVHEDDNEQQRPAAARLGDLAPTDLGFLGFLGVFTYITLYVDDPMLKVPILSVMCYIAYAFTWSPTSKARATVALKAPLPLVRLLTAVHALDLDAVLGSTYPQHTALIAVCMTGKNERIRGLLALGANPDIETKDVPRPLLLACCGADAEAVGALLQAGANTNSLPSDMNSPLEVACGGPAAGGQAAAAGRCQSHGGGQHAYDAHRHHVWKPHGQSSGAGARGDCGPAAAGWG